MRALRDRLIDPGTPASLSAKARAKRWSVFIKHFPDLAQMNVLDLGGEPKFWRAAAVRPERVTLVNLRYKDPGEPWMRLVVGDACSHAPQLESYDLVVSNSLLEHVGGAARRLTLANRIRDISDRHWVQTPNRYFPLEPHWFFPLFQFMPFPARVLITRGWPLSHRRSTDRHRAAQLVRDVELIGPAEMRRLFPDSAIWLERFVGLPKSIVAIRA